MTTLTPDRTRTYEWQAALSDWEPLHEMDGISYLRSILDGKHIVPPMAQTMNMHLTEVDEGYAVYSLEPEEYHYNPIGSVHGGVTATICDSALSSAIISKLPAGQICTTVELHVHYLRAITIDTGRIRCEAHAIHVGRTLATAEAKLIGEQDGKVYAHATITCVVMPARKGAINLPDTSDTRTFHWFDPMASAKPAMKMRGIDYMNGIANAEIPFPPIGALLGMTGVSEVQMGKVRFGGRVGGWQLNSAGVVHGGLVATLCDSAMGCAIHTTMEKGMAYTTSELNVNYIRPVTLDVDMLYADGVVLHSGKQIATAEVKVVDSKGTLYSHGTTTCFVFPVR